MPGYLGLLLEELFEESAKTDFKDKFGEQTFQNFEKAKQRLKNNNMSVDYGQYLKMDKEDVDNLILSLYDDEKDAQKKRILKGEDKEIRGKYNYLGEKGGYKIYQPLDVQASMDLGVNTGWCTTGRYGHEGHPDFTPSEKEATRHFDEYTEEYGVKLYYFLNPSTMYGEYAVALYPEMLDVNKEINGIYVSSTNFELFNAEDYLDYSNMYNLPLDVIPNIDIVSYKIGTVIGYPESLELLSIEEARELPKSVKKYADWWWLQSPGVNSYLVTYVSRHGGVNDIGNYGDSSSPTVCPVLKVLNLESPNLELYEMYNVNNEYIGIYIGGNKFLYKGKAIHHRFDGESNDYETSEIKQFLDNWLKELQSKSKDMKESLTRIDDKMKLFEELFEESAKTDFRDKFGEKTLQNFDKANQRLKNNGYSTDYGQYLKMSQEEIDNLILSLYDDKKDAQRKRMIKGEDKEIRGKYNYLDQPLDVQASMDLGVNTGWCTTGRYGHYGHPEFTPSEREAAKHFDRYTKDYKIKLYYFLNPDTMYGEYAIALYPRILNIEKEINGSYVSSTNFELFTAEDKLDFSAMDKLPLDVIPDINIVSQKLDIITGYPESLELLSIEEAEKLPESVRKYNSVYWLRSPSRNPLYPERNQYAACVSYEGWILDFGYHVHRKPLAVRPVLKISNPKPSDLELYKKYYVNNDKFMGIYIGDNKFLYTGKIIKQRFNKEPDNYDEESNNYETSEIKQFVDKWLKRLQNKSKKMKESLNRRNNKMTLNEYKRTRKKNLTESFEKGSFVVVDNHYPDCEYQRSFDGSMIVCCTYKVIDDLGDKLLCRDPRRRYRKGTTLGELIDKEDILFSSNDLYEAQSFHSNFVKNFDYDKVKSANVNESWVKSLKEDFYWDEEDSFFTRDDLDEFQSELEYELPEVVFHKTYFEPGNSLEVDWDYEGWEETTKVKVDMRRIRYPRDLIRRYAPIVIGMIKDSYEKMERELNESYLKEDWDSLRDLAEEMINYLNDNDVSWVDIYRINDDGPLSSITLEIDGDWKHDHLKANYLLNMKYGNRIKSIQDYSLEDTGSDWGKEAHVIRLK